MTVRGVVEGGDCVDGWNHIEIRLEDAAQDGVPQPFALGDAVEIHPAAEWSKEVPESGDLWVANVDMGPRARAALHRWKDMEKKWVDDYGRRVTRTRLLEQVADGATVMPAHIPAPPEVTDG